MHDGLLFDDYESATQAAEEVNANFNGRFYSIGGNLDFYIPEEE